MKNLSFLLLLILGHSLYAQKIDRIEPPFWYVGMNHNQLELLIYGKDIAQFTPSVVDKNIQILSVKKTENSNYLFLNLDLSKAVSGKFNINFSKKGKRNNFSVSYELKERTQDSKLREGFNSSDAIYLITPDRFANADPSNDIVKGLNEEKIDRKDDYARHGGDIKGITIGCNQSEKASDQITAQEEFVPQWAKTVVWYQIFPERFRDGDTSNNPTVADIQGADPQEPPKSWHIHPWGSDWYKLLDYEKMNGEPEMWKHLLRRRYGGDLQGIIDKLDYLQGLGITGIYLNPVFQSPSLHKYDGESYHHIDPNFGPDPEGDRKLILTENPLDPATWVWTSADELALKLISEAHNRGIKIIFDGVFNHLGINSFAFQDLLKNQQNSPYKDWFIIKSWDDPKTGSTFDYEGWFGVKSLPEFKEDENGIVDGPKQYIFNATERWMNPKGKGIEYGIDGWRLDVAFCIGHPFWKQWRKHVRSINPEAYMTAEIVDTPEVVKPYMQGDEFDGEMNYNFAFASAEFFFNPDSMSISASEYNTKLKELRELYPQGVAYVSQNLFGSHDSNRIGSHIVNSGIENFRNWGAYFNTSVALNNPKYSTRKPEVEDITLQKLFAIMQMTYVGAPMIYYGDEVGMWGGNDPDSRKPMIWDDINFENEVYNADGSTHDPDKVEINQSLYNHYKKLIHIRNENLALQLGQYKALLTDDEKGILIFERTYKNEKLIVIINNSSNEQTINIPELKDLCFIDLLSFKTFDINDEKIVIKKSGLILKACL